MPLLYVVRHAIAEPRDPERWPDDSLRPLTAKGEQSFRIAAAGLRRVVAGVDLVLSSPYARAWRTAEILQEEAGWPAPLPCDELTAERKPAEALPVVGRRAARGTIALVGHEPHLSGLVSLLAGAPGLRLRMKKG